MKKNVLAAVTVAILSLQNTASAADTTIGAQEATAFVQQQFANYFTNCNAFVDSFAPAFEYCDGAPCTHERATLLNACLGTQGSQNIIHSLTVVPSSTNPFNPSYEQVAIKGKQTVFLPLDPTQPPFPLCFDFVITEELKRVPQNPAAISSESWVGYYSVGFGVCQ